MTELKVKQDEPARVHSFHYQSDDGDHDNEERVVGCSGFTLPVSFFLMSLISLAMSPDSVMSWRMSFSVMCWARPRTMIVLFGGTFLESSSLRSREA